MAFVITIANGKGGTAKSATAVNLAAFLGRTRPVLLVDMDPQGHCAESFALDSQLLSPTVYDVLFERCEPQAAVRTLRNQMALLPSNRELALGEVELRDALRREERLKRAIEELEAGYEFVIVDTPPSLGLLLINSLVAADLVLVPISTPISLTGTTHLFELMHELKTAFEKGWDIRVLQTFYRQGVRESEALSERLDEEFGEILLDARINLNTQISMAMAAGRPILDYPDSSGYTDYARLTEEILRATGAKASHTSGRSAGSRRSRKQKNAD